MDRNELNNLILGSDGVNTPASLRKISGQTGGLTAIRDDRHPHRFALQFLAKTFDIANIVVYDTEGNICLHKERRCKSGFNVMRLDLGRFSAGSYKIAVVTATGSRETRVNL